MLAYNILTIFILKQKILRNSQYYKFIEKICACLAKILKNTQYIHVYTSNWPFQNIYNHIQKKKKLFYFQNFLELFIHSHHVFYAPYSISSSLSF